MLFTCPSRYSSTIGHTGVFSLGGWTPQLHARFHESGVTQDTHYAALDFAYRTVTVYGAPFQRTLAVRYSAYVSPTTPPVQGPTV